MATTSRPRSFRVLNLPPDRYWQLQFDKAGETTIVEPCMRSDLAQRFANSANSIARGLPEVYAVEVQIVPVEGGRVIRPCDYRPRKGGAA